MDNLRKKHAKVFYLAVGASIGYVLITVLLDYLFSISIPSETILILISGCMVFDVYTRTRLWSKREEFLTAEEIQSNEARIFLIPIPLEILFALLCLGSVFSAK